MDDVTNEPVNNVIEEPEIPLIVDSQQSTSGISPEHIKPYPKVSIKDKIRKKEKSAILTDTPEKEEIEERTKNIARRKLNLNNI